MKNNKDEKGLQLGWMKVLKIDLKENKVEGTYC